MSIVRGNVTEEKSIEDCKHSIEGSRIESVDLLQTINLCIYV